MAATEVLFILLGYFSLLIFISYLTGRGAENQAFFLGNKRSPWYVVSFGMIGASLSGVTFISVPGWVGSSSFSYLQMVFGYLVGYVVIANILLPLYYRLNLTSIYTYLDQRFGKVSYKTGASFFLFSRIVGASFRLYLVANVLQLIMFDAWGVPFYVTVLVTILLIWLYTFKGGIRTIVWTDTLQTLFMLSAVVLTVVFIARDMQLNLSELISTVKGSELSRTWFFDNPKEKSFFFKQFLSGAFITIVMTGLDQDMMQKNLSCRNLNDAKKNVYWYGAAFLPVNLLFMSLGVLLFIFAQSHGMALPEKSDDLFPLIATQGYLPKIVSLFFILGLIAAAYSSADSALTSLTTSFSIDILDIQHRYPSIKKQEQVRKWVHVAISLVLALVIIVFSELNNDSVISAIFTFAGYTYGPLLGLYAFGLYTQRIVADKWVWIIALISPLLCVVLNYYSEVWFFGYKIGFELLIFNGLFTFIGLWLISKKKKQL
ncbi:MAG: sodium:solute symporter [Bacteroidetes bacterium HGW-Bacteroidetes-4]|jgi:SSS family transporter|nr:MAG: sodium:solute symporter [Bacteroidetes bacterium HGW-Bacteroidetes-4]